MSSSDALAADPSPKPSTGSLSIQRLFNSTADTQIAHFNRVISTVAGLDSTLCFSGYGLVFVSAQLTRLANMNIKSLAEKFASNASKTLAPGETVVATLPLSGRAALFSDLAAGTKIVGGLCSEVRMFIRLFGLLKIWAGMKNAYLNPPKDSVIRFLSWGQLLSMGTYLYLENNFYLATKGVLKGWTPEKLTKTFRTAIWVFFGYLCMDYARLMRVWQLREQAVASGEKEEKMELEKQDAAWWRSLMVDMSYSPLCFHWGMDGGLVSDTWVGLLGASAGWQGFREAWRQTS